MTVGHEEAPAIASRGWPTNRGWVGGVLAAVHLVFVFVLLPDVADEVHLARVREAWDDTHTLASAVFAAIAAVLALLSAACAVVALRRRESDLVGTAILVVGGALAVVYGLLLTFALRARRRLATRPRPPPAREGSHGRSGLRRHLHLQPRSLRQLVSSRRSRWRAQLMLLPHAWPISSRVEPACLSASTSRSSPSSDPSQRSRSIADASLRAGCGVPGSSKPRLDCPSISSQPASRLRSSSAVGVVPRVVGVPLGLASLGARDAPREVDGAHVARLHEDRVRDDPALGGVLRVELERHRDPLGQPVLGDVLAKVAGDGLEHPPRDLQGEAALHVDRGLVHVVHGALRERRAHGGP